MFLEEFQALEANKPISKTSALISLNPYLDDGVIRVGGRLSNSDLPPSAKHPVILKRHPVTTLIIEHEHRRCLHGGVKLTLSTLRQAYWILQPRPQVKSVVNKCIRCAKVRANLNSQIMSALPRWRVTRPPHVFTDCGVDYAGPLRVRMAGGRGHKSHPCYIAIFVCFSVKAVHLELVSEYSTIAFIAAFKRFVSRRGLPSRMFSDCGTNFQGAERELRMKIDEAQQSSEFQDVLAVDHITWKFNPPAAPHFGGLWEAGVRSVKTHMKRVLGDRTPTFEELLTILCQIEAVINSRPLGPLTDHIEDCEPLTPGHFLIGHGILALPEPTLVDVHVNNYLSRWKMIQQCVELFWQRWSADYLQSLQQRTKWRLAQSNVEVGQLVLLKQPNLPPTKWLLGRIEECLPGRDGKIRVVRVKTAKSIFLRPITQIALLPIDLESTDSILDSST